MQIHSFIKNKNFLIFSLLFILILNNSLKAEEEKLETIIDQIQIITKDIKTLDSNVIKSKLALVISLNALCFVFAK